MSNVDLGFLVDVILNGKLDSILGHSSPELILLEGPSLLVGGKVLIRSSLLGQPSVIILLLSLEEESLGNKLVISLKLGIESTLLSVEGTVPGTLFLAVCGTISIASSF